MFVDDIKYLPVICMPVSVLLIDVASSLLQGRKELHLYATDLSSSTEVEMRLCNWNRGRKGIHARCSRRPSL
jgi:hypothetical protein